MGQGLTFLPGSEINFDDILRLESESFNSYDRLDRETLIELFSEFREGFYIIMKDNFVAGYSVFLIEGGEGYIESIAIDNKFRRQGIGLAALKFMLNTMAGMGLKTVRLHVRTDNIPARSLYEKNGFTKSGETDGFYQDGSPAYIYSGDIQNLLASGIHRG